MTQNSPPLIRTWEVAPDIRPCTDTTHQDLWQQQPPRQAERAPVHGHGRAGEGVGQARGGDQRPACPCQAAHEAGEWRRP